MIGDLYLLSICIVYSLIGSLARTFLGMYKAYTSTIDFRINIRRVLVEVCASFLLGTFGVVIVNGIGMFNFELKLAAMIAGFLGADIVNIVSKKIGLTKGFDIRLTDEQVALGEFNRRQITALKYIKTHKRITRYIYQRLNQTTSYTANRDLSQLVVKGMLRKLGKGRTTYYKMI